MGCGRKLAVVIVVVLASAACTDRDEAISNVDDIVSDVGPGLEFESNETLANGGYALAAVVLDAAEEAVVGRLRETRADVDETCNEAMLAAFTAIPPELDDLAELLTFAADASGKEATDFRDVDDLDGRLEPGDQAACAESVLAATFGNVYVVVIGNPDTVDRFIEHVR